MVERKLKQREEKSIQLIVDASDADASGNSEQEKQKQRKLNEPFEETN